MMLLVATTPLLDVPNVVAVVKELNEVVEFAVGNVAEPDSWLARGALMLFNLSTTSKGAAGPVFMRRRGAWAITSSPFAQGWWGVHGARGLDGVDGNRR
jgi:hypothetical protein